MELLITGAIALAGYGLSQSQTPMRAPRKHAPPQPPPDSYPGVVKPSTCERDYRQLAQARWHAALDPAVTGVVDPRLSPKPGEPTPFFRSARAQHTNDDIKQTRMEMFTGATRLDASQTGTYRNKREVEAMFAPSYTAAAVTSSGTAGNGASGRDLGRYEPGVSQNNVQPAERLMVGPGVGVGTDVQAADGFHPMYRVLMENVNGYRRNQLPGRVIPGAHTSSGAPAAAPTQTTRDRTGSLVQADRVQLPSRAAVTGHRVYPVGTLEVAGRPVAEDRVGAPTYFGPRVGKSHGVHRETKVGYDDGDNPDRNHTLPGLNVGAARHGVGGFTEAAFDMPCQKREAGGRLGIVGGLAARTATASKVARGTQRGLTDATSGTRLNPVGVVRSGGRARVADSLKPTHRQAGAEAEAPLLGTRAAVQGGAYDNVWRYKRLARSTARAGQLVERAPGMARVNIVVPSGKVTTTRTDLRAFSGPKRATMHNPMYSTAVGASASTRNRLPSQNPRLADLDTAAAQLAANPYAQPLTV